MIVTIDGPVASGKSSVARQLAMQHGWYYINSGLFFRLVAWALLRREGHNVADLAHVTAADMQAIDPTAVQYRYQQGHEDIAYQGDSLTAVLKNSEFDQPASVASTNAAVRDFVLTAERALAQHHAVVIDGRDTGSVVFVHAPVKIYLTADVAVRAMRWQQLMQEKGRAVSSEYALHEVQQRDTRDMTRTIAPLIVPDGAYIIDATHLSVDQVVSLIDIQIKNAQEKGAL